MDKLLEELEAKKHKYQLGTPEQIIKAAAYHEIIQKIKLRIK